MPLRYIGPGESRDLEDDELDQYDVELLIGRGNYMRVGSIPSTPQDIPAPQITPTESHIDTLPTPTPDAWTPPSFYADVPATQGSEPLHDVAPEVAPEHTEGA